VGDPVCTTFCEKVTRGSDTPSGEGDSCEFVSFIEVDAGEDCPASKFEQVSKTDDLFYKQFYDDQIFVEGGDVKDYFVVDPSKKICLIAPSLGMGGIERAMSTLANSFSERGFDIHFITIFPFKSFFQLNKEIQY
jgi:hypothetical protein